MGRGSPNVTGSHGESGMACMSRGIWQHSLLSLLQKSMRNARALFLFFSVCPLRNPVCDENLKDKELEKYTIKSREHGRFP